MEGDAPASSSSSSSSSGSASVKFKWHWRRSRHRHLWRRKRIVQCEQQEELSRAQPRRTAKSKNSLRFFTVWHPRYHPYFLMFCTRGTFNSDLDKKKNLLNNSLFAIRFLCVFFMFSMRVFCGLWSFADSIRKWSRANPAYVSGCIWTARRDRGLLLFGGDLMDLVVVWWSFDGSGCCLVVICGHLGARLGSFF